MQTLPGADARLPGFFGRTSARVTLGGIIILALGVRAAFVLGTPAWQSPDEYPHYWYADQLASKQAFPPASAEFPGYEAFQPPLYYVAAAIVISVLPSSQEFSFERIDRPNTSLVVLRLLSVLLGGVVVWAAWSAGCHAFPDDLLPRVGAALFVALLPTFVGVGASVTNDAAVSAFSAMSCLCLLRSTGDAGKPVLAGMYAGLAILSKSNAFILLPLGLLRAYQLHGTGRRAVRFALVFLSCALPGMALGILKNLVVVGHGFPLNTQFQPGWNITPGSILWAVRNIGWSFLLAFGRTYSIALPAWCYLAFTIPAVGLAGLGFRKAGQAARDLLLFTGTSIALAVAASLYYTVSYPSGLNTSWGKNIFPVLLPIAIAFAVGWRCSVKTGAWMVLGGFSALFLAGCAWGLLQLLSL